MGVLYSFFYQFAEIRNAIDFQNTCLNSIKKINEKCSNLKTSYYNGIKTLKSKEAVANLFGGKEKWEALPEFKSRKFSSKHDIVIHPEELEAPVMRGKLGLCDFVVVKYNSKNICPTLIQGFCPDSIWEFIIPHEFRNICPDDWSLIQEVVHGEKVDSDFANLFSKLIENKVNEYVKPIWCGSGEPTFSTHWGPYKHRNWGPYEPAHP